MSTVSYQDAYKTFLDGGFAVGSEVLPASTYRVRIALVKGEQAQGKKFKVGVRLVVLDGEQNGKATWINQTLTPPDPNNEKSVTAFMMFLKFMVMIGVPQEVIRQGVEPERLHEHIVVGTEGVAQLGVRPFNGKNYQELVSFQVQAVPSALGGMLPVGAAPAVAPVAAPVAVPVAVAVPAVVAPPAIPQPAPIQQPAPVPAPAPAATVEELQAQLAALQSQVVAAPAAPAPVAVQAAPIPGGPSF